MDIRSYKETDTGDISRLYFNTIHRINARDYSPEQIRAWAPGIHPESFWKDRFKNRSVIVAEDHAGIVGFTEMEKSGHIDCFYVHHLFQGRGIGRAMMNRVFEDFQRWNIHRAFAEVSITARGFFERMGFSVKNENEVEYNGVSLKLYLMEKYF